MSAGDTGLKNGETRIVRATSTFDCGGRCPLRLHVKDGVLIRVEGDDAPEPDQLRTCMRCRAYRQFVYHPERLKHPMKRVGKRGEGKFKRISWDEALETIARELKRVKKTYGNPSIFLEGGGYQGALHRGTVATTRLLSMFGGYTTSYGNISSEGAVWAVMATYGDVMVGHSREDLLNSRLIIMWGWDPVRMISGTDAVYNLIKAKEAGIKIICIDPRYHDSAATFAGEWIPIIPGTDTAMMVAMANVMIKENLHDRGFLDKYTLGFDKFSDYVLGIEDGIEKTPRWAETITSVPAQTIERLAREYAATKPAALMDCQGPARSAMGEQYNRCAIALTAMTGNIGKHGGSAAGGLMGLPIGHMFRSAAIPGLRNPAEEGGPSIRGTLDLNLRLVRRIHTNKTFDAFLRGKAGGYPADIKMAWFVGGNCMTQRGNTNKGARALESLEFIAVSELFMTPTARYADVLLPVTSAAERNDLTRPWPSGPYFTFVNKAIEPLGECKSDLEIATELAERLGFEDFNPLSEEEWLRKFVAEQGDYPEHIKDYDKFKAEGIHRVKLAEPIVAFQKEIEDPEHNPFPTPSGKIEIFSQRAAELNNPLCPPVPKHVRTKEDRNDPLIKKYPLQLLTPHAKNRVHSSLYKVDLLRETEPHLMWINSVDAEARGVKDGDEVYVFNDRGKVAIKAWVTERIIPGVVCIFEGAWYDPDKEGVDRGGCANVLTDDSYSEGGAATLNNALVQVSRA
ncbi:MAG: molybdopterin-dependent oxidoreductase [Chloroflexota bacterium]|nr:molybdopterin-dependent oxidoreductase [Chloroflexota bacterium]